MAESVIYCNVVYHFFPSLLQYLAIIVPLQARAYKGVRYFNSEGMLSDKDK